MPSEKRRKEEKHKELKQSAKSCNKISNFFVAPIPVNENVIENQTTTEVLSEELINESMISPVNENFNQDNCYVDELLENEDPNRINPNAANFDIGMIKNQKLNDPIKYKILANKWSFDKD